MKSIGCDWCAEHLRCSRPWHDLIALAVGNHLHCLRQRRLVVWDECFKAFSVRYGCLQNKSVHSLVAVRVVPGILHTVLWHLSSDRGRRNLAVPYAWNLPGSRSSGPSELSSLSQFSEDI